MPVLQQPEKQTKIALFRDLTEEDLAQLGSLLHEKTFPAGALVMTMEQPGVVVYIVRDGTVKVYLSAEDGNEVILSILGAGQTVGEMSVLDTFGRSANVVTMERSTLLWMSGDDFRRSLHTIPDLSYNLLTLFCRRMRLANEQIQALSSLDVTGRVARQILAFAEQYQDSEPWTQTSDAFRIPLRLTQRDIASIVGTSRERVNRVMVRFKERGFISVDGGYHISIHDSRALAGFCR